MCGIFYTSRKYYDLAVYSTIQSFLKMHNRGPDSTTLHSTPHGVYGFHHLGIISPNVNFNQPYFYNNKSVIVLCNGEIYNWKQLVNIYKLDDITTDCDIIGVLYTRVCNRNFESMIKLLDGEFAVVLHDLEKQTVYAARDIMGIRPLYYGVDPDTSELSFLSSELKGCSQNKKYKVSHIIPRCVYSFCKNNIYVEKYYELPEYPYSLTTSGIEVVVDVIYKYLYDSITDRLQADRPIGCLLSGGLDSSIIVSIASKIIPNIRCFTIGVEDSSDIESAKKVAKFLNVPLDVVYFNYREAITQLPKIIETIETFDITTIRASTPQYFLAKWISKHTDIKVILSGEGSDELFSGYIYSKLAPNEYELWHDSKRLLEELYMFDCLRTDRTMSAWGLEVRVPFLNKNLINYVLSQVPPQIRMCNGVGHIEKYILRKMAEKYNLLPETIIWRPKEAFSDAVSSKDRKKLSWYKTVQQNLPNEITEGEWYKTQFLKYYPSRENVVPHLWMPKWTDTKDPSATVLSVYETK